jgi:hypothetical protein
VLDALARDFPGGGAVAVSRELTSGAGAPTAYFVRIGDGGLIAYAPDGTRR